MARAEMVLEDAPQRLIRRDILLEWPEDFDKPDPRHAAPLAHPGRWNASSSSAKGQAARPIRSATGSPREAVWKESICLRDYPELSLHPAAYR